MHIKTYFVLVFFISITTTTNEIKSSADIPYQNGASKKDIKTTNSTNQYNKEIAKAFPELNIPPRETDEMGAVKKWQSISPKDEEDAEDAVFALWQDLVSSETLRAKSKTPIKTGLNAIVGLKIPGSNRGIWKSQILINKQARVEAESALLKIPGILKTWEDKELPIIGVKVDNFKALDALRKLPFIDYIHPRYIQNQLLSSGGCDNNSSGGPPSDRAANGLAKKIEPGDILPFYFDSHRIPEAWKRSQNAGANITIGILDTGIYNEQSELSPSGFIEGMSGGRSLEKIGNPDSCNHGTRMIGLIAAPRNGKNIVGVAYRANIVSIRSQDAPLVGLDDTAAIVDALRILREEKGARVFTMAFGNPDFMQSIIDRIRYDYHRNDLPSAVYVGAIGTTATGTIECTRPVYPANMDEVIGVAAVDSTGTVEGGGSCSGYGTDVAGIIGKDGDIETTGRSVYSVVSLGGSSGGTAVISGIVALILSEYPWLNADQLKQRLYWASRRTEPKFGYGIPDAYKAIGGFIDIGINGPARAYPDEIYTITALPTGDGPFTFAWSDGSTTQSTSGTGSGSYTVTVTDTRENKSYTATHTVVKRKPPPRTCPSGKKCCERMGEGCSLCWPANKDCP